MNEVPQGDVGGEQDNGDQDHHGGIDEFLVFFESLDFWVGLPRPRGFAEFGLHFTDESEEFLEHWKIWDEKWQDRQDSNLQPSVLETDALPIELLSYDFSGDSLLF